MSRWDDDKVERIDYTRLTLDLKRETEKAFGVVNLKDKLVWLPKSLCSRAEKSGRTVTLDVPEWLAGREELI